MYERCFVTLADSNSKVAMFVLEMPRGAGPSDNLKTALTSAVLAQFCMGSVSPGSAMISLAAPSTFSSSIDSLVLSQSTRWTRSSLLLLSILAREGCCQPSSLAPGTIRAVAAVVQHCESNAGQLVLDGCDSLELAFILDTVAQQPGTTQVAKRTPGKVREDLQFCSPDIQYYCWRWLLQVM